MSVFRLHEYGLPNHSKSQFAEMDRMPNQALRSISGVKEKSSGEDI